MALRKHWPELLDSLHVNVMPKYRPQWSAFKNAEGGMWGFESWAVLQNDSERPELLKSLQDWGARFRITEAWIFQTALDTLQGYSEYANAPMVFARPPGSEAEWFWLYAPRAPYPAFQPRLAYKFGENVWYPQEDWKHFRNRVLDPFMAQMMDYRRAVEARLGAGENLARDAEWTARYQKGEQATEIGFSMTTYYDLQTVYRAVERFALAIGLNLRKVQRRRQVKR
jgi:hypothetical protein